MKMKLFAFTAAFLLVAGSLFAADGDLVVEGTITAGQGGVSMASGSSGAGWTDQIKWYAQDKTTVNHLLMQSRGTPDNDLLMIRLKYTGSQAAGIFAIMGGSVGIGTKTPGTYALYVNGTTYSYGGYQGSDIKYKKNIIPLSNALEKILNLNGVSFQWKKEDYEDKDFPEGTHFGLIAQDIETVLPNLVKTSPEGEKGVAYTEIIPLLIEAIKAQQKEIEILKSKLK